MSSQLGNEDKRGAKRDYHHASYPDLDVDILRELLCWICGARPTVAQASCGVLDVRALPPQVA